MKCPRCQQENPAHARFCLGCGARLALACASCGTELPGGAKFCLQCGEAVAAGSAAARPGPAPEAYTPKPSPRRSSPPSPLWKLRCLLRSGPERQTEGGSRGVSEDALSSDDRLVRPSSRSRLASFESTQAVAPVTAPPLSRQSDDSDNSAIQAACESDGRPRRRIREGMRAEEKMRTPLELRAPQRIHHPGSSMRCPATLCRRVLTHSGHSRSVACALTNAAIRALR